MEAGLTRITQKDRLATHMKGCKEIVRRLTSSNMSSFSSSCLSSWRERRCGREGAACAGWSPRKVGVPSTVVTRGFSNPPRSNSWADIFLPNKWVLHFRCWVLYIDDVRRILVVMNVIAWMAWLWEVAQLYCLLQLVRLRFVFVCI